MCVCGLPSVWNQESTCHLIETNIRDQEELEGKKVPQYPCLWVNVSAVGRWAVLYHTEDTRDQNQQVPVWVGGCHISLPQQVHGPAPNCLSALLWRAEAQKNECPRPGPVAGMKPR